jgi:flagellar FliJ protein
VTRAARLRPILDRLLEIERQARHRLAACEAERAAQQARLDDLRRYAGEYRQRAQTGAVGVAMLREHQQFVARLEQLALAQERVIESAEQACAQAREGVRRSEGLRRLIERYQAQAQRSAERREQRALDDWVNARAGAGKP